MSANTSIYYLSAGDCELCTIVVKPSETGKYPTVILRSPYESHYTKMSDAEAMAQAYEEHKEFIKRGFAFILQHCRGTGKSTGDSDAFIYEREDGLALQQWIREQDFYNGEIFLSGGSYCGWTSMSTAPFADDIKGVSLDSTDCELYNFIYLNGFYRSGLHGCWYIDRYKSKSDLNRNRSNDVYLTLPMTKFSESMLSEPSKSLDEYLMHPDKNDEFWNSDMGGVHQRRAIAECNAPMLVIVGFVDIFNKGCHDMWDSIKPDVKQKSAFVVHPYGHGGFHDVEPFYCPGGNLEERLGRYEVDWFDHIRNNTEPVVPLGKITYYEIFSDGWSSEGYDTQNHKITVTLGKGEVTYSYDPKDPAIYEGGLSNNFKSSRLMPEPYKRKDVITCYTGEFEEDIHVRGSMKLKLKVKSDRLDTAFYTRIGIVKENGDVALRDSIVQLSNFYDNYEPNTYVDIELVLDRGAFMIKKGEKLRIDVTSSAHPQFVPHTNNKGLFTVQDKALIANNTVVLDESSLTINYI
ncbi:MAG: CocE/NonD family hydrolase [Clostridiales bacterium]|nr:CocE/NonD family hydrolase [Clostridiales bacterium]